MTFKNGVHSFPAWHSTHRNSVENKPASLLVVFLGKALNKMPTSLSADRWPTHALLDYNCEVAHPACRQRRLLGTHQWQSALLLVGLPVIYDWFETSCHLSPSLILIRLMA